MDAVIQKDYNLYSTTRPIYKIFFLQIIHIFWNITTVCKYIDILYHIRLKKRGYNIIHDLDSRVSQSVTIFLNFVRNVDILSKVRALPSSYF